MNEAEVTQALTKAAGEITTQVKALTEPLDTRLKSIEASLKDGNTIDPALKSEVANLAQKHADFVTLVDGRMAELKTLGSKAQSDQPENLYTSVKSTLYAQRQNELSFVDQIKAIKDGKQGVKNALEINLKAVGDMSTSINLTGAYFQGYDQRPGIKVVPLFDPHLRGLFPQTTTEKPFIRYQRETAMQGGPDMTAEAALKPQMDFSFDEVDATVRKIAGYFRISEEMIDDIPYLLSYMSNRGVESLKNIEDYQILHGDGTGQNLAGLDTVATAFAAGTTITTTPNEFDTFVTAKKQLRNKFMMPTHILVNPENYATMRLRKATTGEPLFPYLADMGTISVDGTPIIQNTRVAIGSFYVMDARWIEIVDRMQTQVRLYDQDRDNAIKNMVTCVIEERLALPIYRAECVIKGTFSAAVTDLTS